MTHYDDIVLELARIEREALARIRKRMSEQQLGEAWKDLPSPPEPSQIFRGLYS